MGVSSLESYAYARVEGSIPLSSATLPCLKCHHLLCKKSEVYYNRSRNTYGILCHMCHFTVFATFEAFSKMEVLLFLVDYKKFKCDKPPRNKVRNIHLHWINRNTRRKNPVSVENRAVRKMIPKEQCVIRLAK